MSTMGQTGLDCQSPQTNLVVAQGREQNRPDHDPRRNCLTSIYWVPTIHSSTLLLASNLSDHVHYYQGGKPFQYILFDPETQILEKVILGPELHKGHRLQVPVKGGMWKCGHMLLHVDDDDDQEGRDDYYKEDYTIIGEAVAPGFDFHDFAWITKEDIQKKVKDSTTSSSTSIVQLLMQYVYEHATEVVQEDKTVHSAAEFYHDDSVQKSRMEERSGD